MITSISYLIWIKRIYICNILCVKCVNLYFCKWSRWLLVNQKTETMLFRSMNLPIWFVSSSEIQTLVYCSIKYTHTYPSRGMHGVTSLACGNIFLKTPASSLTCLFQLFRVVIYQFQLHSLE